MNILLTGASGLIGMAMRPVLATRDHQVVATDATRFGRDDPDLVVTGLDDRGALETLIHEFGIEAILHCGAISGPMMAKDRPLALVSANIDATALLLDLARVHRVRRFVFCSSISVYGDVGAAGITEATLLQPTSVYGATKVACEQLIRGFAAEYDVDGVSLRIGRVYGPYRRANCHLQSLLHDTRRGLETVIPCDPNFIYHYVYVDDVVEAMIAALEAPYLRHREYNVGGAAALTMPEILSEAMAGIPGLRGRLVPGKDDVPDSQTTFNLSLIDEDLGWRPRYDIGRGMQAYRDAIDQGRASPLRPVLASRIWRTGCGFILSQ